MMVGCSTNDVIGIKEDSVRGMKDIMELRLWSGGGRKGVREARLIMH
jgi:hypothetical protein